MRLFDVFALAACLLPSGVSSQAHAAGAALQRVLLERCVSCGQPPAHCQFSKVNVGAAEEKFLRATSAACSDPSRKGGRPACHCKSLRVTSGDCDAFHVYWNCEQQKLDWWRL